VPSAGSTRIGGTAVLRTSDPLVTERVPLHGHEPPPAPEPFPDAPLECRPRDERRGQRRGGIAGRTPMRAERHRFGSFDGGVALTEGPPGEEAGLQDQLGLHPEGGGPPQHDVGQVTRRERPDVARDPMDQRGLGRVLRQVPESASVVFGLVEARPPPS